MVLRHTLKHRRRREAGLTLVEMLIAVALMGIILLGIAPLFIASVKSNYSANEYTSLHNLARDRLEQLMNLTITDPQLLAGAYTVSDLPATLPDPVTGIPPSNVRNPLSRTYVVTKFVTAPPAVVGGAFALNAVASTAPYNYKRIDVTVESLSAPGVPSMLGIGHRAAVVSGFLQNPDPVNNIN